MRANREQGHMGRLFTLGLLLIWACSGEQSEFVYEEVILQLPTTLRVTTILEGYSCAGVLESAQGRETTVQVEQINNTFVWTQTADSTDGLPLKFVGRVCDAEGLELRLKAESVIRIPQDDGFCRTTLLLPEMAGFCGAIDDLCQDPATVRLTWDECTGTFNGRFTALLSYSEACVSVQDCRAEFTMSAGLPRVNSMTCAEDRLLGVPKCQRLSDCQCSTEAE